MLDHRIAHGLATDSIRELSETGFISGGFREVYQQKLMSGGVAQTVKGARRKCDEFFPILNRSCLLVHQGEDKKLGPHLVGLSLEGFHGALLGRDIPPGTEFLSMVRYRFTFMHSAFKHSEIGPVGLFTRHAVARNHQRNGQKDKRQLASDLLSTLTSIFVMSYARLSHPSIQQVYARAGGGLYVGLPAETPFGTVLCFKTFLNIENLQPKYRAAVASLANLDIDRFTERAFRSLVLREYVNVTDEEKAQIAAMIEAPELKWMHSAYEDKRDMSTDHAGEEHQPDGDVEEAFDDSDSNAAPRF